MKETLLSFNLTERDVDFYSEFIYITFFWLATNRSLPSLIVFFKKLIPEDFPVKETLTDLTFLKEMQKETEKIDMLRAILTKLSIDTLDSGLNHKEASKTIINLTGIVIPD
ncbi:hypothetical protein MCHI_001229 [Candidatus Magnetoovum chiemensis]|nr:hypothetical protein MCHI_001229 [Candidatus Magnetoovum chiemensis]